MAKRKQRRFTSEEQILKAIDSYTTRIRKACVEAEQLGDEIPNLHLTVGYHQLTSAIQWNKEQIIKLRRSVTVLETKKRLMGEALSRFRTIPLPGMGDGDNSVVV